MTEPNRVYIANLENQVELLEQIGTSDDEASADGSLHAKVKDNADSIDSLQSAISGGMLLKEIRPSDTVRLASLSEVGFQLNYYYMAKSIQMYISGVVRISFSAKVQEAGTALCSLRINGEEVYLAECKLTNYKVYTVDKYCNNGDAVELWIFYTGAGHGVYVKDFTIGFDMFSVPAFGHVLL